MKTLPLFYWNGGGILVTSFLYGVYSAATWNPVFWTSDEPRPTWYSIFCAEIGGDLLSCGLTGLILVAVVTPIHVILVRQLTSFPKNVWNPILSGIAGILTSWMTFYTLDWGGRAVKGVFDKTPTFSDTLRSFLEHGGIYAVPFVATLISFFVVLAINRRCDR